MCLGIYLASDHSLPELAWTQDRPAFHVAPISESQAPVRAQFTRAQVYHLGSHTHCGCGFADAEDGTPEARATSLAALALYVTHALTLGPAEIFVCWYGEYEKPAARRFRLTAHDLAGRTDWLAELTFVELYNPAP